MQKRTNFDKCTTRSFIGQSTIEFHYSFTFFIHSWFDASKISIVHKVQNVRIRFDSFLYTDVVICCMYMYHVVECAQNRIKLWVQPRREYDAKLIFVIRSSNAGTPLIFLHRFQVKCDVCEEICSSSAITLYRRSGHLMLLHVGILIPLKYISEFNVLRFKLTPHNIFLHFLSRAIDLNAIFS